MPPAPIPAASLVGSHPVVTDGFLTIAELSANNGPYSFGLSNGGETEFVAKDPSTGTKPSFWRRSRGSHFRLFKVSSTAASPLMFRSAWLHCNHCFAAVLEFSGELGGDRLSSAWIIVLCHWGKSRRETHDWEVTLFMIISVLVRELPTTNAARRAYTPSQLGRNDST